MWDRKEIKEYGKMRFKANYWYSVLCAVLISIVTAGSSVGSRFSSTASNNEIDESINDLDSAVQGSSSISTGVIVAAIIGIMLVVFAIVFILKIFVFNPLQVGCYGFFRDNATGYNAQLDVIKSGFTSYGHTFVTMLLKDIFLMLWTLLFIIPGIVKAYSYRMVPFILRDNPELTATEVITRSRQLMDGQKWNVFVFDLSYIGWYLLGMLTLGLLNVFWTSPYFQNANAALYLKLIGEERLDTEQKLVPEEIVPVEQ